MAARPGDHIARHAPLLSLPLTKGFFRGPQKLDKVLRQQPASPVPGVPSVPSIPTTQETSVHANFRVPIHKQHSSQLSQVSQLPRHPLIPQTSRMLIHKQQLSQVSQVSQLLALRHGGKYPLLRGRETIQGVVGTLPGGQVSRFIEGPTFMALGRGAVSSGMPPSPAR